ncbi:transposase [Kibdelosporangium aridum]|uniref:Putative transposase of IS4/5 family n=1 Tax=Kibdelosporangium aridum TaxID=2030 RepID=A0A1Y5XVS2_KIBAR|nr:transposase [Kibdelosporangium aridum]SMD14668.1 Putative transposase of IS4/5 family [Kibdelosporangium aridum]
MVPVLSSSEEFSEFDLLTRHLWPKFGDIYDYNLNGGEVSVDPQEWTAELKKAVRDYLLNELPDDVAPYLFDLDAGTLKNAAAKHVAVDVLITEAEPWEVAIKVQQAAVKAVPTLDELIGHLSDWPSEDERADTEEWLLEHANDDVLKGLVDNLAKDPVKDPFTFSLYGLTHEHQPFELLAKWHQAMGAAPSDLTDAEWELIVPFLPIGGNNALARTEEGQARLRQLVNGMLYRYHYGTGWTEVPRHYGDYSELTTRYANYKRVQVFRRMLAGLANTPGAERLVEWLRHIEATRGSRR